MRPSSNRPFSQNSPVAYSKNQENAIPIKSFIDDENDTELRDLLPILEAINRKEDVMVTI